jgi:hypothetical protein
MCGLVALIAKRQGGFFTPDPDIFQQLLYADAIRGWDATGCFGVTKGGNVTIKKQAVAAGAFLLNPEYNKFKNDIFSKFKMLIGHNRKATHGAKKDEDSHPFWSKNEKIVLVHNGMINNHLEFCKESTVDSAAVCNAIEDAGNKPIEVLEKIKGAYALIWYNVAEKKLYFCRNDARPLWIVETDNSLALVSEHKLAEWIFERNNQKVGNVVAVKSMILFSISLGENKINNEGTVTPKTNFFPTREQQTTHSSQKTGAVVIALPAPKTTQQPKPIGGKLTSPVNLRDNLFLSDTDVKTNSDIFHYFCKGNHVQFEIDSFIEQTNTVTNVTKYKINGSPLNLRKNKVIVQFYIDQDTYDLADFTSGFIGEITSAHTSPTNPEVIYVWVKDVIEIDYRMSSNNVVITEEMYTSPIFPKQCRICKTPIQYHQLSNAYVKIENRFVTQCLCKGCRERFQPK